MEGNREVEGIRKGPWKAEEDEVLISHVSKYGPRDWSSIRSKGLLQRTGKSCRLRWVNKLRPNLKSGCKFSLEEERVVIELQSEFGNKWARIATYLPGRTDNDVKNFWSSRQKKLARLLHNSNTSSSSSSKPPIATAAMSEQEEEQPLIIHGSHHPLISEVGVLSSSPEGDETMRMVSLPDLFGPRLVSFEEGLCTQHRAEEFNNPTQAHLQQPESGFSAESHDILAGLDPYYDMFLPGSEFPLFAEDDSTTAPDCFFDDFPVDMFDQIEPLPSPSDL